MPQDIPGSQSVTNSPKGRWREGKIHGMSGKAVLGKTTVHTEEAPADEYDLAAGMDLYDYHSLHNDLVRGTSL